MVRPFILILFCWGFASSSLAAKITASVDRNPVHMNESFQLLISAEGDPDGAPDFSPLEVHFEVLGRSQSSSIQIINGSLRRTTQWELTLMPKGTGEHNIPAIPFGADRSNPVTMTIKPPAAPGEANSDEPVFLEVEVDTTETMVQGQILYVVRLLRSVNLRSGSLSEPAFQGPEVMMEKLGEDRSYETQRNGVRYMVAERRYALFPQQAGTLSIEAVTFQGQIVEGNRFNLRDTVRTRRLQSRPLTVTVQPQPADWPHPVWLPASELRLVEEWPREPPRFQVGEPVTRTLTLMAAGVASAQLPAIPQPNLEGLKVYPDKPLTDDRIEDSGLIGIRQEKTALLPTTPGQYRLPAIEVHWWNTRAQRAEVARLPERVIEVEGTALTPSPAAAPPGVQDTTRIPDIEAIQPGTPGAWPWISLLLACGWGLTGWLWWRTRHSATPQPAVATRPATPRPRATASGVRKACRAGDSVACKTALLEWSRARWPDGPPISLGQLASRVDRELEQQLRQLNRCLYSAGSEPWQGDALLAAFEAFSKKRADDGKKKPTALAPLYPESDSH